MQRLHILIQGQVQGVGFRPHVYRVAQELGLTGWVGNNAKGVVMEVQGKGAPSFLPRLLNALPALAKIHDIQTKPINLLDNEINFQIIASEVGENQCLIPPDTSPCEVCLEELFDSNSRYYRYPFINCTACGPRFTITESIPYDRAQTTMKDFPLCPACHKDYAHPTNRRYHAESTACSLCGPQLSSSFESMAQCIQEGGLLALKAVGGYQLIADATNEKAILRIREGKRRDAKPLALMVLNMQSAAMFAEINAEEESCLESQARPIVVLKKIGQSLPNSIAPGLNTVGIMLPSSPVHYLLFHALLGCPKNGDWLTTIQPKALVVTSGNDASEPLLIDDDEAHQRLSSIADLVVKTDRTILTRVDDSVVRVIHQTPIFLRRARGFVPEPIFLPKAIPSTLGLGGHLKNTFCITRGNEAFVSQHMGSLSNKSTRDFFHESLVHWMRFLNVKLESVACDRHPDYYTSQIAHDFALPVVAVQHHHAHLAAVVAEHHVLEPALGLALDGHGYGADGSSWGGELFLIKDTQYQRLSAFHPLALPGGEKAIREPWRMGAAVLHALDRDEEIVKRFSEKPLASKVAALLKNEALLPMTTSCGRLFDAASALLGVNTLSDYEGQAAMQFEALVSAPEILANAWTFEAERFNLLPMFKQLLFVDPVMGANRFHGTLIAGLVDWVLRYAGKLSIRAVLLGGGCFLNQILTEGLCKQLSQQGLRVYLPSRLSPNDSSLSLGQAWVAGNKAVFPCV